MKNIVILMGSPRRGGNTELLTEAFINGARAAGNNIELICPAQKNINPCLGCNYCYADKKHRCVRKDDMSECYEKLAVADIIVIATPVYFYGVSAQLKCLIDRLHNPVRNTFHVKKLALLAVCADTNESVFDSVKQMYFSVLKYFSLENAGIITVYGVKDKGDIVGSPALGQAEELGEVI